MSSTCPTSSSRGAVEVGFNGPASFHWRGTFTASEAAAGTVIEVGFTGRAAAAGSPPYRGFNLGGHVGDDPQGVTRNRSALAAALHVPADRLLFLNQTHGAEVLEAQGPWRSDVPEGDAVISAEPDLALAVLVADCVPVLLHDVSAGLVAAVHAGRQGLLAGIVPTVLDQMREHGARAIGAVVGPSVCGRCYEVPADLAAAAAEIAPSSLARSWSGTPAIDVAAGVVAQLHRGGVSVDWVPGCTREDDDLYSHRRDGVTGRFAGVIVRRTVPTAAR
jgi:YfiH family protein